MNGKGSYFTSHFSQELYTAEEVRAAFEAAGAEVVAVEDNLLEITIAFKAESRLNAVCGAMDWMREHRHGKR